MSYRKNWTVALFVCLMLWRVAPLRADLWSTGYYPGWEQSSMPASNIDFTALTHIIHFSLVPNVNGSLNSSGNSILPSNSADIVNRAHAAGKKVYICVGGAGTQSGFEGATTNANRAAFISNLTNFLATYNYDGIDIDWEPLQAADANQFTNLVKELRTALNGFSSYKAISAAAGAYSDYRDPASTIYSIFNSVQSQLDQINIMTYDLSGPYGGWVTWFDSPLFDNGYEFPSTGGLVPSVDGAVRNYLTNGVAAGKLGIGIAFYGYSWTGGSGTTPPGGVTQPRQSWTTTAPTVTTPSYTSIMTSYYQTNLYHWDTNAQSAYLSITNSPAFVSYDDQHTCQVKVSYARNHGLGGVMIWELALDYFAGNAVGQRAPLLTALKQSLATPAMTGVQFNQEGLQISFTSLPLAFYRILWSRDLTSENWNTLTNNITGTGGILQIIDTNAPVDPQRFYRVRTPP